MESNRRRFMVVGGTTLAGVAAVSGSATGDSSDAPNPDHTYEQPTMGNNPDAPVCTVYGSHNCPYTEDLIANSFGEIIEEFVEPGRLNLQFRAMEYDSDGNPYISENGVLAGQAAEGVWDEESGRYWHFFAELWKHMPGQVDEDKLESIMQDAGVENASYIADNLDNWDPEVRENSNAAHEEGVDYSPTLELKGDLGNRKNAVEWIEQRLDGDGGSSSSSSSSDDTSGEEDSSGDDSGSDGGDDKRYCPSEEDDSSSSGSSDSGGTSSDSQSSETTSTQDTSSSDSGSSDAKTC